MISRTAGRLLSTIGSGVYSTRELIGVTGHSPNTVVKQLEDLERHGLIVRVEAHKPARGRPPIIHRLTPLGVAFLDTLQTSSFLWLRNEHGALWGPRRSSSFWGVPLFGRPDIFARRLIEDSPFEVVLETRHEFYESPASAPEGVYPNLEAYIAWAAGSGNPRLLGGTAVLLKRRDLSVPRLRELTNRFRTTNRVGFLASVAGARRVAANLDRGKAWETMLVTAAPLDGATNKVASQWRVRHPVAVSYVREVLERYGRPQ